MAASVLWKIGPRGEQRLGGFERVLHRQQVSIAQDDLQGRQLGVGAQDEQPVELRIRLGLVVVDREVAGPDGLHEAPEAFVADQRLVAMGELAVEAGQNGCPSVGILPGLLLVAAEHIAPSLQRRLLNSELGLALLARNDERHRHPVILDHLVADLLGGPLAHAERSSGECRLIFLPGLLCDERLWRDQAEALSDIAAPFIADLTQDDSIAGPYGARGYRLDGLGSQAWRNRPIEGEHPYVYLDGIVLKRSWAGEVRNVSLLVAIGVNHEVYREILGICEGVKEDKAVGARSSSISRNAVSPASS